MHLLDWLERNLDEASALAVAVGGCRAALARVVGAAMAGVQRFARSRALRERAALVRSAVGR